MNPRPLSSSPTSLSYKAVGVDASHEEANLGGLGKWITDTFEFNACKPILPLGYFANVLRLSSDLGLAISTDGVGTKILIAQELSRYDTIGIDCVAMNANDIICVGAKPISLVDYIAVEKAAPSFLADIAKGLHEGARQAGINIPGGEIAQIKEMLHHTSSDTGFDLVGTCVGTVHPDRLIVGDHVEPGDLVVGLESSGVHSNGLTLARKAFAGKPGFGMRDVVARLGRPLGEELLEPTFIYVKEVVAMIDAGIELKALIHITSDGFMNLTRVKNQTVGYVLDSLPPVPAIFSLIQEQGNVPATDMFRVFNMGIGFCVVVAPGDAGRVQEIATAHGRRNTVIGYAVNDDRRRVRIPQHGLVGTGILFEECSDVPPSYPGGSR